MSKLGKKRAFGNCSLWCTEALNSQWQCNAFILIAYHSKEPKTLVILYFFA